jgi:hypothetical protein
MAVRLTPSHAHPFVGSLPVWMILRGWRFRMRGCRGAPVVRSPRSSRVGRISPGRPWSRCCAGPRAGQATVRAVLAAAHDAVAKHQGRAGERVGSAAAVARLLDELDARDRVMVSARLWAQPPLPQAGVAQRLGVTKAWVNRNQPRATAKFAELLADPTHREVSEHAAELARRLGPYTPADALAAELRRLDLDPDSETAYVVLHLAGPYVRCGQWLANTTTGGAEQSATAVDEVFDRCPAPSTESLLHALIVIGMPLQVAAEYVGSRSDWRCFDGDAGEVWVRWGQSAAAKAEAVLHVRGAPATAEDIFTTIGAGPTSFKALREALYADPRFTRASPRTWGLRGWRLPAYASIAEQIAARIDAAGGQTSIDELIADLRSRLPDVVESSIRTTLTSLAFITDDTTVRRRTEADDWPAIAPLYTARGCSVTATTKYGSRSRSMPTCCADRDNRSIPRWPPHWESIRVSAANSPARTDSYR